MFQLLGRAVSRFWYLIVAAWAVAVAVGYWAAPRWESVAQDREFAFLPPNAPSRVSDEEFRKAFPEESAASNIMLVVHRTAGEAAHVEADKKWIEDVLEPDLRQMAQRAGWMASEAPPSDEPLFGNEPAKPAGPKPLISRIRTPNAPGAGALLVSADGKVLLVLVELTTEFMSQANWPIIAKVDELVAQLRSTGRMPTGLDIALTGSAVIGRDQIEAELRGVSDTGKLTVAMVVLLLMLIYRAPFLALIPLVTVFVSVQLSLDILSNLAGRGHLTLFQGLQIYLTILAYGAGVDYCLFLTARYQEVRCEGSRPREAVAEAVSGVGHALLASAATVICGIGMMAFAEFGKFRQAGLAIPLALALVLLATLTLSPALFRLAGRWAFWPRQSLVAAATAAPCESESRGRLSRFIQRRWERLEALIQRRPWATWLGTIGVLLPFAIAGIVLRNHLSYDLINDLPADAPSVLGTRILREHMPPGIVGPANLLIVSDKMDFRSPQGRQVIEQITQRLREHSDQLGLADVRSLTAPLGFAPRAEMAETFHLSADVRQEITDRAARDYYLTDLGGRIDIGARFDLIVKDNPFCISCMPGFGQIEPTVTDTLPPAIRSDVRVYLSGLTASVRDLSEVMMRDRERIQALVVCSVLVVLILLLRQAVVPLYLMLSVLFSYFVTLGVCFAVFAALDPHRFSGIDWKVAIFLFTILVAVGEDYNIFLMTRIEEETPRHGPLLGITEALIRTGPIISSCGIIMAGTFASLLIGRLSEMKQLGFALAFGVLLDTFVVRPILVPAFLVLFRSGRLFPFFKGHAGYLFRPPRPAEGPQNPPPSASTDIEN